MPHPVGYLGAGFGVAPGPVGLLGPGRGTGSKALVEDGDGRFHGAAVVDADGDWVKLAVVVKLEEADGADAPVVVAAGLFMVEDGGLVGDAGGVAEVTTVLDKER